MKILCVAGARPNFVKIAPLMAEFLKHTEIEVKLVHTGQHYDKNMSDSFFQDLEIPHPDIFLGIATGNPAEQTANILIKFDNILENINPDIVIVVGDVNSTLACALASVKRGIKVAHVEAGLRSFNRSMPEEINRVITDHISNFLFITEKSARENLKNEGITTGVHFVGNVMIDCLKANLSKIEKSTILDSLEIKKNEYILATFHRAENVDKKENLLKIIEILNEAGKNKRIVFPIHPRTLKNLTTFGLLEILNYDRIKITEPLGYLDFINLEKNAFCVLTDSGGIQEETTFLGTPCITAREDTERPITVEMGTNKLTGLNLKKIKEELNNLRIKKSTASIPELWDGKAAERIVSTILEEEK